MTVMMMTMVAPMKMMNGVRALEPAPELELALVAVHRHRQARRHVASGTFHGCHQPVTTMMLAATTTRMATLSSNPAAAVAAAAVAADPPLVQEQQLVLEPALVRPSGLPRSRAAQRRTMTSEPTAQAPSADRPSSQTGGGCAPQRGSELPATSPMQRQRTRMPRCLSDCVRACVRCVTTYTVLPACEVPLPAPQCALRLSFLAVDKLLVVTVCRCSDRLQRATAPEALIESVSVADSHFASTLAANCVNAK